MTFVPHSRVLPRALWRPALFFFALAQIFLSFGPLFEARNGPDSRAHIEEAGTRLHHTHDESDCAACVARGLLATADPERPTLPEETRLITQPLGTNGPTAKSAWTLHTRSRAPPSLIA
jgi:hypothetical protein